MTEGLTGIILAGGASRRMGQDKAFLDLGGRPLISLVSGRLRAISDEVLVVADSGDRYAHFADRCVADVFSGVGTLGGIHAGLQAATHDRALVVGCDMPFLNPVLLTWFADAVGEYDLAVLKQGEWLEPLHAVYRKSCLPAIEAVIQTGERCAFSFYDQVRVRYVDPVEISHLDSELRSFCNVNTSAEWGSTKRRLPCSTTTVPCETR